MNFNIKVGEDTRHALLDIAYVVQVFAFIVIVTALCKAFTLL